MARNVRFYGSMNKALGGDPIQRDYAQDPRRLMAQQLMQQGSSTAPVQSPLEGLTRALSGVAGGYFGGQAQRDMQEREQARNEDINQVIAGGNAKQWVNPDTGNTTIQQDGIAAGPGDVPTMVQTDKNVGGYAGMQAALANIDNPDIASFRQNVAMGEMQERRALEAAELARTQAIATLNEQRLYDKGLVTDKNIAARELKNAPGWVQPKPPRIENLDGVPYYTGTGEKVFPNVLTSKEKFLKTLELEPPSEDNLSGGSETNILDGGGQGNDDLTTSQNNTIFGGSGEETLIGGTSSTSAQPSIRDLFMSFPPEIQSGIKMAEDPQKAFSAYLLKSKGMDITVGPDGQLQITQGGDRYSYGKKTTGTIEDKLFNAKEGLVRLDDINNSYRPEFQQMGTRFKAAFAGGKDFLGMELSKDEKNLIEDYTSYKTQAINNINLYIKEITGAQMSEPEATRLRQGIPDPGDSWWEGDSPVKFKSKLDTQSRTLRSAAARFRYGLKNGWDMNPDNLEKVMPLEKMETVIENRGLAIERQVRARRPNLEDASVERFVKQQLMSEFGQ